MSVPVSGSTSSAAAAAAAEAARQRAIAEAQRRAEEARRRAEEARKRAAEAAAQAQAKARAAQEAQKAAQQQKQESAKLKTQLASAKPAEQPKLQKALTASTAREVTLAQKAQRALQDFQTAVGEAGRLGKAAVKASETANAVARAEGKPAPFSTAAVQKADDGFEALKVEGTSAKLLAQLRNEKLGNVPFIGDKLVSGAAVQQGEARGRAAGEAILDRALRELGGDLSQASPRDLNRAIIKAMRSASGEPSLLKDDALTRGGLDPSAQRDVANAYGKGLGTGLREALTEALGTHAGRLLEGKAGGELQALSQHLGEQIGERAFGPVLGKELAQASREAGTFSKKDFNAEQAAEAAATFKDAAASGAAQGAKALDELLTSLPRGARADFLAQSQDSLKAIGEDLNSLGSIEASQVRTQLEAAAELAGKRGPELLKTVAEARVENALEISPERGAQALAEELEHLPASQKRDFVDDLAPVLKKLGAAIDVGEEQQGLLGKRLSRSEPIDVEALRASLDKATLAAGAAGGELALQVAEGRIEQAAKGDEVEAAEVLREEIEGIPSVAGRAELLKRVEGSLETIAEGAVGEIDEEAPRHDILRDFSAIAELSGRAGTEILAHQFADAQEDGDETHTDVDDGNQLGGAFREVLYDDGVNPAFGIALAQELKARGGVGDAADDVAQGVYEGMNDKDPNWAQRAAGDVWGAIKGVGGDVLDKLDAVAEAGIDAAKAAARFASDAFDFVTKPLTDAINGQIDKLGPGDSYKVAVGGGANIRAVGVAGEAQLEIQRGEDGGFTVSLAGEIEADVAKKLKLPLTLGADGRVEFEFDSVEDAKRAAGTLAQIGGAAVAGSTLPGGSALAAGGAALANLGDGDVQFLAKNVSAVEFGTTAAADLSSKLGLPGMDSTGTGLGLSVSSDQRARIEFTDPPSVSFTQTLSGEVEAGLGAPGGQGISLSGSASAEFEVKHQLTLPEGFGLSDVDNLGAVARGIKAESSVQVQLSQEGNVNAALGPFEAGASGKLTETFTVSGSPSEILKQGVPAILRGDVSGAVKAMDENYDVEASIEFVGTGSAGANATAAGIGVTRGEEIAARLEISGDPLAIARDGLPRLLQGDIPGAAKAVGDNVQVEVEISTGSTTTTGADIKIDAVVADAHFSAQRTDVESDTVYAYGVDEPRTATQTARELERLWG